ncbi:SIR2 family protein [uncultured Leifsonia sp.]|uniref:SIR2 family protein n=1 Tax=uncultured Leifsonia sp. TaxID=340359 RepID=UPI0028D3DEEC|nr:SIR2 family protein [uncultured Leifsonia sp.]
MTLTADDVVWITGDVAVPQPILDAQEDGSLVFFVGAGASVDAPSSLPLFGQLAERLAELAQIPFDNSVPLDVFLGSMPKNFDVHRHARALIADGSSAPNATHASLIELANATGQFRVVTTNFDTHLTAAATSAGTPIPDTWVGPALPLGDDFTGLVHLHGSVDRDPRELVLTDEDFGRAYLTNAWATRFLLQLFREFTVVFVGYSHDDPIMRYLALGLPSKTARYAFTASGDAPDPKWTRLGVHTVSYPVVDGSHDALVAVLTAWNTRARMGRFEHRARMLEIVEGGAKTTPVERDYINARLATPEGAHDFASATRDLNLEKRLDWLLWLQNSTQFKNLFSGQDTSGATAILGDWFSTSFIAVGQTQAAALQVVQRLGQSFSPSLFRSACLATDVLSTTDPTSADRWRVLLATSIPGISGPIPADALLPYQPSHRPEHTSVLRAALRPQLTLKRYWSLDGEDDASSLPDAEVHWNIDEHTLTTHIAMAVEEAPPGELVLAGMLEEALHSAYDLLDAYHGGRAWDQMSFARSAIEPHPQDEFREPLDAIIDALRDYGSKAIAQRQNLPDYWWKFDRTLFKRLALHIVAGDASRNGDDKLSWLLSRTEPFESAVKHEAFRLIRTALPSASASVRAHLLGRALIPPALPEGVPDEDHHAAYAVYNRLVWLTRSAPTWNEAREALSLMQTQHPDFSPRDHPDFDRWMSSGTWGGSLPMEPDEFIREFDNNPVSAFAEFSERDYRERRFEEPTWDDAQRLLSQVAKQRPDVGSEVWKLADRGTSNHDRRNDIQRSIIEGWADANLGDTDEEVLQQVEVHTPIARSARAVSRFLLQQIHRQIEAADSPLTAGLRRLATLLWQEQGAQYQLPSGYDPLSAAPLYLNSWPGELTRYWTSEVDRRWRNQRDDWTGLDKAETVALIALLEEHDQTRPATLPAIAAELYFIFSADPHFASTHVLPAFREPTESNLAWHAYLYSPRFDDKLLAAGFLECVLAEWTRLDTLGQHGLQQQFFGLVTAILSFAGISPGQREDLLTRSVLASDGAYAPAFSAAVSRFVGMEGVDGEEVWKLWLREHVKARLDGIPRIATPEELSNWADAATFAGDDLPAAMQLFEGRGITLSASLRAVNLAPEALAAHGSIIVRQLAERADNTPTDQPLVGYRLRQLIADISAHVDEGTMQPLLASAARFGAASS